MKALKTSRNALRPALLLTALAAAVLAFAASCSDQREGEPCDIMNGSEDCAAGLECTAIGQQQQQYRCCQPGVITQVCDPSLEPTPGTTSTTTSTTTGTATGTGGAGGGTGGAGGGTGGAGGGTGGAGGGTGGAGGGTGGAGGGTGGAGGGTGGAGGR
ncbi:hypothetical protein WMF18_13395 [Sorangium sp. So ce315]|uniref:hypothetical protein n=1 Tax=Sorangium sp. So ce315 TaxID=3133299 RepID=UPI003F601A8F